MKKNLTDFVIAFLVIACSLVLLAALAFALSGWGGRKGGRTLEIDFADVTGIHLHSELRYAGAPAGSISAIRLLKPEERMAAQTDDQKRNAVRVTATLRPEIPPLPADIRTSISSDTLLSDKFVALSAGTPDGPQLPAGTVLQGQGSAGLDTLIDTIGPTLQEISPLLKKTSAAIDVFKDGIGDALPKVSKLLEGLKTTSDSADGALKRLDKLIADTEGPIKDDLLALKKLLVQIEQTVGSADQLVTRTDRNLNGRMQELSVVLENLKVVSTHAKALTQQLAEKPNRLIFSGKPPKLTSEQEILRSNKPLPAVKP